MPSQQSRQSQLPPGWKWAEVGDVCELKYGSSLPARLRVEGPFVVYGSNGPVGSHTQALIDGPAIIVGRKGSVGAVHISEQPCWPIDTTYYVDEHSANIDLAWLKLTLYSLHLGSLDKSSAIPGLNRRDVYRQSIPLPPLPEQKRIVAVLNKQLAAVERAKRAVAERLEAAQALLESQRESVFDKLAASHVPNVPLKAVITSTRNGFGRRPKEQEQGPIVLRIADVSSGQVDYSDTRRVSMSHSELETYALQSGDLLFVRVNGSQRLVGTCIEFTGNSEPVAYNDHLIRVRLDPRLRPSFVSEFCKLRAVREFMRSRASTSAGQFTISRSAIEGVTVPAPKSAVQESCVSEMRATGLWVGRLSASINCQQESLSSLQSALLRCAFSGGIL